MADEYTLEQPFITKIAYTDGVERPYERLRHLNGMDPSCSGMWFVQEDRGIYKVHNCYGMFLDWTTTIQ